MPIGMLGNKVGMTQIFDENGLAIPITIIKVGPCYVTQIKTKLNEGYNAIQIGYAKIAQKHLTKPELGHLEKANVPNLKHLVEYRVDNVDEFTLGQSLTVENLEKGQFINVSGKTIGHGFSGNQKRHNFKIGPMSHGSKNHRAPGSIGAGTSPGRVLPGKRMAGHYGNRKQTIKNLQILEIDNEDSIIIVKGSVPGKVGNLLNISISSKK
uniref:Large ribosomal subunit protein uL3c n=1 Tax=Olisthodiscus luteus TaxID=83000 RepID=A0A7U0KSX5_OLILU|nr:ribosomal protein L3 [Olisthodiscus luteus]QQW50596.1 ribosomal protein L3 [Olisthodiscus luteus]